MAKAFEFPASSLISPQVKMSYSAVFALYLLVLLWLVLFKFSLDLSSVVEYPARTLNLVPFADASKDNVSEIIFNLIAFVPLGLFLNVKFKGTALWRKLVLVLALSVTIETVQFIFVIGITDITTNTVGGFLELLLYAVSNRYIVKETLDCFIAIDGTILLSALLAVLFTGTVRFYHAEPPGGNVPLERGISQ